MKRLRPILSVAVVLALFSCALSPVEPPQTQSAKKVLKFPGVVADLENRIVDVEATVCLDHGALEVIACTRKSREHESILVIDARPMHIHAALLAVGVVSGNPGMMKQVNESPPQWIPLAPSGGLVEVSLVIKGNDDEGQEYPIGDFVRHSTENDDDPRAIPKPDGEESAFPGTFMFCGSQLYRDKEGKTTYLADQNGNVISISTFGDEVLGLPGFISQDNTGLEWEVNPEILPKVGTGVILRLRPAKSPDDDSKLQTHP